MFYHYLRQAVRNFVNNGIVFWVSILTIIVCTISISLLSAFIKNELTVDDIHKNKDDIYLITFKDTPEARPEVWEANLFFNFDFNNYPEVENITTIKKYREGEIKLTFGENSYSPAGIVADSNFLEIFDFDLALGDRKNIMKDPDAVILSSDLAEKVFGNENPVGKPVRVFTREDKLFTIRGVLDPIPSNSTMEFDFIIPDHAMRFSRMGGNFIKVNKGFNSNDFVEKISDLGHKSERYKESVTGIFKFSEVYFNPNSVDSHGIFSKYGNRKNINILFAIIVVIFIISLLNFSNLQIININSSVKNIGINKITGAGTANIVFQKLTEVIILVLVSTIIVTIGFGLLLPSFNDLTGVSISPSLTEIILLNLSILVVLSVSAMIYPIIVYKSVSITGSLKSQLFGSSKMTGRNLVAVLQFGLSLVLLVASIVVSKQLNLMLNKDLGFSYENTICTQLMHSPPMPKTREEYREITETYNNRFQYIKDQLSSNSVIKGFSLGFSPIEPYEMTWKLRDGDKDYTTQKMLIVTPEYANLLGLEMIEGRFFDREKDMSRGYTIVINETARDFWGITDISNQRILNKTWSSTEGYEIIGVVRDFNFEHLSNNTQPLLILFFEDMEDNYLIKFEEGSIQAGLNLVETLFSDNNPGESFTYDFLSDEIENMYLKERRQSKIYILFTLLAFLISAMGMFAVAIYESRRRVKEIGIRKVNGASIPEILLMLNKDFLKWVLVAFIIACPVSYFVMSRWLESFAYKTSLDWWIFALAGLCAFLVALTAVSFHSWRAASGNPVEAIRYE